MAAPSRVGRPKSANADSVQFTSPVARFSSQAPIRPSRWICRNRAISRSTSPPSRQVRTTPSKKGAIRTSAMAPVTSPAGALTIGPGRYWAWPVCSARIACSSTPPAAAAVG